MQVSDPNNVKIYNLSNGKSLPDWLSDRKKRRLQKTNVDIRRRIELIQDFDMPGLSTCVKVSPDGQYIMATGIYKPRFRCYDVNNLAMKFERCFDSEVVAFDILSNDYSKVVFLQCDRYVEFHAAEGRYYRLRIPKFGHDIKYHRNTCDLYLAGASSDIYRLNLERGQFLSSLPSQQSTINKISINEAHGLVMVGSMEGKVEAWDPRAGTSVSCLDCAFACYQFKDSLEALCSITSLEFNGPLHLGVGTSSGQVLLYDIRSNNPFTVKDHLYGLPIRNIAFSGDKVLSMDSTIVKIWNKRDGVLFTSIDSGGETQFNDLCLVPGTGMMFIANENVKIRTYYIPRLGPAPKWCGFLDALTEELEENVQETIYDDYKFVTRKDLEQLGLQHLVGTTLLRAYMHGYFMDARLYRKAKASAEPFAFEEYKKKKIREKVEEERKSRVQVKRSLPTVNRELALKLMQEEEKGENFRWKPSKATNKGGSLLKDERFKALFENPEYEVDTSAEEYRLLNPLLKRLDKTRKETKDALLTDAFEQVKEKEGKASSDESSEEKEEEYSSEEDNGTWVKELKKEYKSAKRARLEREKVARKEKDGDATAKVKTSKFYELKCGRDFAGVGASLNNSKNENALLGDRVEEESKSAVQVLSYGNKAMTYKKYRKEELAMEKHCKERKSLVRAAPKSLRKPKFWAGPRKKTPRKVA